VEPDDFEAQFVRSTRRRRAILTVVLTAVVVAPFAYVWWQRHKVVVEIDARHEEQAERERAEEAFRNRPLSESEAQRLRQLAPSTRQALLDMRAAWQRNVTPEALAAREPTDVRCPVAFRAPTIQAGESYARYGSMDGNYFGDMRYEVFGADQPIPEPEFARMLAEVDAIAAHIAGGKLLRPDLDALSRLGDPGDKLFVLADKRVEPVVEQGGYLAGQIVGAAYLYRYAQGRVICAGEIDAKNSPEIEISYTHFGGDQQYKEREAAKVVLARDLDVALRRAIATGLRAVE
jgi:hypothetical protein